MLSSGGCMQTGTVKWIGEQKFVATSPSGHAVTVDSDRASNKAPGPMELVLLAPGGLHRHRRCNHPGKEAAEVRIARSDLLGRTRGRAAYGLDEAGNTLSSSWPTRGHGGKARHPAQRGQVLLRCGHASENCHTFVAL